MATFFLQFWGHELNGSSFTATARFASPVAAAVVVVVVACVATEYSYVYNSQIQVYITL